MRETDIFFEEAEETAQREQAVEDENRQLRDDLTDVFGTPAGRRVYAWLLQECMVFERTMTGNAWTNYNEGKRAIGLKIMRMLDQARVETLEVLEINQLELYLQMRKRQVRAGQKQ